MLQWHCTWLKQMQVVFFFFPLFLKCWFERTVTQKQFAEVNIVQRSSYRQVCLKCWQRDVMNSLQIFSLKKKLYIKLSAPGLSIITTYAWKGRRLCPSEGCNYICPSELHSRKQQHIKTRCCCLWCLQPAATEQRAWPWARGFQGNTCTSAICLHLGVFTELRSFSKPWVNIQLLIKWLKISFLHIPPCLNSFAALPPLPVDRCVWPTLEQVFYISLYIWNEIPSFKSLS